MANIDSMSTVLGERRGQRRFSYKANSGPISSHILSGDFCFFFFLFLPSPPFLSLPLCVAFVLSFIFILLKAKRKKKNKVDKGCPPSSQQRGGVGWGVQIALQKTGLRAEISHNAADKKVGHITFGGHVTGMQTADSVCEEDGDGEGDAAAAAAALER